MDIEKLYHATNIAILFVMISIAGNMIGFLGKPLSSFYISISVLTLSLLNLYRDRKNIKLPKSYKEIKLITGYLLIILSLILVFSYNFNHLYPVISIPILFIGLDIIGKTKAETDVMVVSSTLCILLLILLDTNSIAWFIVNDFSKNISILVTSLTGRYYIFGYSSSGFFMFILSLSIALVIILFSKRSRQSFIYPLSLFLIWIAYIFILGVTDFDANSDTVRFLPILCLVFAFVLAFQIYKSELRKYRKEKSKLITGILTFLLISTSILILIISPCQIKSVKGERILFYGEDMLGTWDTPEYGKYGKFAPGMFGLLPYYLKIYGYNCTIFTRNITKFIERNQPVYENLTRYVNLTEFVNFIEDERITENILKKFDVFVVINLNTTFSNEEKKAIWKFVRDGGSLLVLGDHTGMDNLMISLNDLLKNKGIAFRFDSALPLDPANSWLTCYNRMNNPVNFGISNEEIEISVGASLNITPPAFPIIVGDFAFSDYGDVTNVENAYLGDYDYGKGELLGDVVLVAGRYYGKGRILVFGDTTTFQNPSLPLSHRFVSRIFSWLANGNNWEIDVAKQTLSFILLIFAAILIYKNQNFKVLPFALLLAIIVSIFINSQLIKDAEPEGPLMYIDATHVNRFSMSPFNTNSLTGTMINFARNGYLPLVLREFNYNNINRSSILLIVAPNEPFSDKEVKDMMRFMEKGGLIILSSGYQCRDCVIPLLNKFKLDIDNIPLGPAPYVEENPEEHQMEPKFVDAWPILVMNKTAVSYYDLYIENQTYTLAVFIKHGKGGLILIADNEFFLDKNIESINSIWPGNIQFIKNMIDDVRERGVLR